MDYNVEYDLFIKSIVDYVKKKFPRVELDTDDLYQAGWDELIKANARYDSTIAKLTTYAMPAVNHRIMQETINQVNNSVSCVFFVRTPISVKQDEVDIADEVAAAEPDESD